MLKLHVTTPYYQQLHNLCVFSLEKKLNIIFPLIFFNIFFKVNIKLVVSNLGSDPHH